VKNIFVGNLDFNTTAESVRPLFERYGVVHSAKIATDITTGRSRGFAYVEMENDAAADRAISALDGYVLDGRPLAVAETKPARDGRSGPDAGAPVPRGLQALLDALKVAGEEAGHLRPARPEDLERARKAGFPRELLDFYSQYEPDGYVELDQRICGAVGAVLENQDAVPGIGLFPHGYVAFATTTCGDVYCMDTNVTNESGGHPIVLFGHEAIDENTELPYIQASRIEVASSLDDFFYRFASGVLSEDVHYPRRF
jgi:RNA recognition motif. (a.k.a. RRM, RBD, or RNP domain)